MPKNEDELNIYGSSPIKLEKRVQGFKDSRGQGFVF